MCWYHCCVLQSCLTGLSCSSALRDRTGRRWWGEPSGSCRSTGKPTGQSVTHTHTYTHTGGWGANPRVSQWHTAEGGMRVITWVTVIITIPMCDCEIDSLFSLDVALMFFYFISKMCVCICFHRTFPFSKCMLLNKCYGMVLIHNHYLFLVCRAVPLERIFRRDSQLTCLEKVSEWEFQISSLTLCITWWRVNE